MTALSEFEIRRLLAAAMSYDQRKPGEANVLAWIEASDRGRWDFDGALEAIHEHYVESTAFLMPAHVTERLRARRSQPPQLPSQRSVDNPEGWHRPALHAGEGANPTGAPARPEHIAEVVAKVAGELGWEREIDQRSVFAVTCPYCGEQPGYPCTRPTHKTGTGVTELAKPHPSRIEAAREAATAEENPQ